MTNTMGRWRRYIAGMLCAVFLIHIVLPKLPVCRGLFQKFALAVENVGEDEKEENIQNENTEAGVREDGSVVLNATNFPDRAFRYYVSSNFDKDGDGVLSEDERLRAFSFNLDSGVIMEEDMDKTQISSLEGIEYFANLVCLSCENNLITSFDLTENEFLKLFRCNGNPAKIIDMTGNPNLKELSCGSSALEKICLEKNIILKFLSVYKSSNLKKINLTNNKYLSKLSVSDTGMESIDLRYCPYLENISLERNPNLTYIAMPHSDRLETFVCTDANLQSLDLSKNKGIKDIDIHNNRLVYLHLKEYTGAIFTDTMNQNIRRIYFDEDYVADISDLNGFDVSRIKQLKGAVIENDRLVWNGVSELVTYSYKVCEDCYMKCQIMPVRVKEEKVEYPLDEPMPSAPPELMLPSKAISGDVPLTKDYFPDSVFRNYIKGAFDLDENGYLDENEREEIQYIYCKDMQIQSFEGLAYLDALSQLRIYNCEGVKIDISHCRNLKQFSCQTSGSTIVGLRRIIMDNPELDSLYVDAEECDFDFSGCQNLKEITLNGWLGDTLDFSGCSKLVSIRCLNCKNLEKIKFGENNSVEELEVRNCYFKGLDVSNLSGLKKLVCPNNYLRYLDLAKNICLEELDVHGNQLAYLDLDSNTLLEKVEVGTNIRRLAFDKRDTYSHNWEADPSDMLSIMMSKEKIEPNPYDGFEVEDGRLCLSSLLNGRRTYTYKYYMSEKYAAEFKFIAYKDDIFSHTTESPILPTESPSTPTESPILPTEPPSTPTESPEPPTEPPSTPTESPEPPTEPPSTPTERSEPPTVQPPVLVGKSVFFPNIRRVVLSQDVSGKKILISWKKKVCKNVTHVEIYRSTKKYSGYRRIARVSVKRRSYTDKKVKQKVSYYYRLRYTGMINGKTAVSAYTKQKKIAVYGLKIPNIKVKKKKLASGISYLEIRMQRLNGTYLELYVRRNSKYQKVKLASNRVRYYHGILRVRYLARGNVTLRIRSGKKVKGKRRWSPWSNHIVVK